MNNQNQEGIVLKTESGQFTVAPGASLELALVLQNKGLSADQVRITVEGIPQVWVSTEQPVVLLQPGEERQIILTIQPPAPPNSHAGRYHIRVQATSTLNPSTSVDLPVILTIAGYEVKGRVGVLLDGVQYSVIPGEQLTIPVVLINQGLGPDSFRLALEGLADNWIAVPDQSVSMEPGEVNQVVVTVNPPREPSSTASRYPFQILVISQEAPDQGISIDCTLTVAAFTEFKSSHEEAKPDENLPAYVQVENLSNMPESFQISWSSPDEALIFEPTQPQQINIPSGETVKKEYTVQLAHRPWFGGEKNYSYNVEVRSSDQQTQTLQGSLSRKGIMPTWVLGVGIGVIAILLVFLVVRFLFPGGLLAPAATTTPTSTSTATGPLPTATQSPVDQKPLLVGKNWYLVSYNDTYSSPGVQEAYALFNSNNTLIGYTGCKNLNGSYLTNYNQISVTNINLGAGTCPDATLQKQEDAILAILRSARSYYIADTALQVVGDIGFLNYSLTPLERPEEPQPPKAVIQAAPQAQVGQVIVFDGSASSGQNSIVSWKWDFGDGQNASGEVVQHTYQKPGTYSIQLKVTDKRNQTGEASQQIHILALPTETPKPSETPKPTTPPDQPVPTNEPTAEQPTATPELIPPQANIAAPKLGYLGEPVEFDASKSKAGSSPIVSYSWSFGNGASQPESPDPTVKYIYEKTGYYEVMVTVIDANGLISTSTTNIPIEVRLDTEVWTLTLIKETNQEDVELLPGTAITLQFLENDLVGFAGCNEYRGEYTAIDNGDGTYNVAIKKLTTSRRLCPKDIMDQEKAYLEAFEQVTMATIEENMLTLAYPDGSLVFFLIPDE